MITLHGLQVYMISTSLQRGTILSQRSLFTSMMLPIRFVPSVIMFTEGKVSGPHQTCSQVMDHFHWKFSMTITKLTRNLKSDSFLLNLTRKNLDMIFPLPCFIYILSNIIDIFLLFNACAKQIRIWQKITNVT